jgi:hypothetical protein
MMEEMRSDRDRLESNRTPRIRADEMGDKVTEGVMEREWFSILESYLGRPISKNSVVEGLSMRRFADIHEETSAIALSRKETISRNLSDEKGMKTLKS